MTITEPAQPEILLADRIATEIQRAGPIPFAHFMELALYAPGQGYYERSVSQTGRAGDFYTSVSIGNLFGQLIGYDLARKLRSLGDRRLQIIEAGAHDGQLAFDILAYFRAYVPDIFERLEYLILEPSAQRCQIQHKKLAEWPGSVRWHSGWNDVRQPIDGAIISNELLDAMPVHVFRWNRAEQRWSEWGVTFEDGRFAWAMLTPLDETPAVRPLLPEILPELGEVLPDRFSIEVSPLAIDWWKQAARRLNSGWLMAFDYGLLAGQVLAPERTAGTLRSYSRHRHGLNVLDHPGEQDITSHVSFSGLIEAGEAQGLKTVGLRAQGDHFLETIKKIESEPGCFPPWTPSRFRQLASLTHPEHLGRAFKTLVQQRLPG